jgi:hypothetical protein
VTSPLPARSNLDPVSARFGVLADSRLLARAGILGFAAFVAYGLISAIIPNPVFGRQIPPEPFAIGIWVASAPLVGLVTATWLVRPRPREARHAPASDSDPRTSLFGSLGGIAAFLAIGCPVCNKVALVLLGTTGALNVWAPLQPIVGAVSLALLGATLWWRLGWLARGGACAVR